MLLDLKILAEKLSWYDRTLYENYSSSFDSIQFVDQGLKENVLYLVDMDGYLALMKNQQKRTIVLVDPLDKFLTSGLPPFVNVLHIKSPESLYQVYNDIQKQIQIYQTVELDIYKAMLREISINELLVLLSEKLTMKFAIVDRNKKLFANPYDLSDYQMELALIRKDGQLENHYGYLVIATELPPLPYETFLINLTSLIANYVYDSIYKVISTKDTVYLSLKNFLTRNIKDVNIQNIWKIGWDEYDQYQLYVIELKRQYVHFKQLFIKGRYHLDNPLYLYSYQTDDYLVLLLNVTRNTELDLQDRIINDFQRSHLRLIKSNDYYDILHTPDVFDITRSVLALCKGSLINMNNLDLSVFFQLCLKHGNFHGYITKDVYQLYRNDEHNGSDLLATLYYYLLEERSLLKAAKQLNIHRNSIVYRLSKINELISIDYDDYHTRQNLLISIQLLKQYYNLKF